MNTKFDEFIQDPARRRLFEQESLAFEAAELISGLMEQEGINKAELARRIGKSKAFVTQLLSGSRNMTVHTFADLAFALGNRIELSSAPVNDTRRSAVPVRSNVWRMAEFSSKPYQELSETPFPPTSAS